MKRLSLFMVICLFYAPSAAFAWGDIGHRIICQIAWERLTPGGKALVREAIGLERYIEDRFSGCQNCRFDYRNDARHLTFQTGCIWPDESRRDTFKGTYEYHFVNIAQDYNTFDLDRDCATMDCAVVAIQRYALDLALKNPTGRNREVKALALRFLGHFVGDIHQPLHAGHLEDLGGNSITVRWKTGFNGAPVTRKLHAVWDSDIMKRGRLTSQMDGVGLNNEITDAEAAAWQTFDIAGWAGESYRHAQDEAYRDVDGALIGNDDLLGDEYFRRGLPIVKERLKKAGVRLAFLINSIAAGTLPESMIHLSGS